LLQPFYCPIPEEQKPVNEYLEAKKNPFIGFITSLSFCFKTKEVNEIDSINKTNIFIFLLFLFLISFCQNQIFVFSVFFFLIIFFVLIRWNTILKRFQKASLFYEEASWFDGQYWEKFSFLIKNDRLLLIQKILPFFKNIFRLGIFIFIFLMIETFYN
jgi:hypothetical protein